MSRAIVLLLDSFGVGASLDAKKYGDAGADTFGHIAQFCAEGKADCAGVRSGLLHIPHLVQLGLAHAHLASTGVRVTLQESLAYDVTPIGRYGYAVERSLGKDTPSGHWEIAGVPVMFEWGYFPPQYPSFPDKLINELIKRGQLPGVLGNKHASGTTIIEELGEEHIRTGKPIVYTSADSVFQIAAHETHYGLQRLYDLCAIARELVDEYNIGRVIARPFIGEKGAFHRTGNRKDLATPPPERTLLDHLKSHGREVISIGKVADIYAHCGITQTIKADNNMALFDATLAQLKTAPAGSLIFTNFVDFDSLYGHRRDVAGYAAALEAFDARLPELFRLLQADDLVVMTADHGCDPTMPGSDHTREHIPVLAYSPQITPGFIGRRDTFADIGQTLAQHLAIPALSNGVSF